MMGGMRLALFLTAIALTVLGVTAAAPTGGSAPAANPLGKAAPTSLNVLDVLRR